MTAEIAAEAADTTAATVGRCMLTLRVCYEDQGEFAWN